VNCCDINVLVYAMREDSPHHEAALRWLEGALTSEEEFGWHPLMGASLIRIATNRRVFADPSPLEQCLEFIEAIIAAPVTVRVAEGERFWPSFTQLLQRYRVEGPRVSDMYWAALAIEHDATFCSADRGFGQFAELRWQGLLL
jgi:toxin-antitoxin system PIN domain toxin